MAGSEDMAETPVPGPADGPAGAPELPGDAPADAGLPSWLDMDLPDYLRDAPAPAPGPPAVEGIDPAGGAPPVSPSALSEAALRRESAEAPAPPPSPPAEPVTAPCQSPAPTAPQAAPATQGVFLEKVTPVQPEAGRTLRYGVQFKIRGGSAVRQVRVEHELPPGAVFLGSEPRASRRGRKLVWDLGTLAPGAALKLQVRIQPNPDEPFAPDAAATFNVYHCLQTQTYLARPRLVLTVRGPGEARQGEPVRFEVRVTNHGAGPATAVTVQDRLPLGLDRPEGEAHKVFLRNLAPGQSRAVELRFTGTAPGAHLVEAAASCAEGAGATAHATVRVTAPALTASLTGPRHCVVNEPVECALEVGNPGTAAATGVEVTQDLPAEVDLLDAPGAAYDAEARRVSWRPGDVGPGQTRSLALTLAAREPGDLTCRAEARAGGLEARAEWAVRAEWPAGPEEGNGCRALDELLAELQRGVAQDLAPAVGEAAPASLALGVLGAAPAPVAGDELEFVVFTLAGTDYAVPIGNLVEMSRPLPVTPVPNLPEWVLGVANVRGDIVSLVDLRLFLGLERCERPAQQRLLVVRARGEDMTTGLLVDQVRGLRRLPASSFEALAAPVTDRVGAYLQGLAEYGGRLLAVLDLDRLLLSAEMRQSGPAHEPAGRR
jgi:uncharacterized repeat protein (TIGR01451 family)